MACELIAGYEDEKPYHFKNNQGVVVGTDADLLREVLQNMGCNILFKEVPWKRTLDGVKEGKIDIAIGAKYLDKRAKFAFYSPAYKKIRHWLYTRKGEYSEVKSIDSFFNKKNAKLGVMRGWGYPPMIANALNNKENAESIIQTNYLEQLPKILDAGRCDGIIFTPETLENQIRNQKFNHDFTPIVHYEEELHFLFSKENVSADVVAEFNASLIKLVVQGYQNKIFEKYKTNQEDR